MTSDLVIPRGRHSLWNETYRLAQSVTSQENAEGQVTHVNIVAIDNCVRTTLI